MIGVSPGVHKPEVLLHLTLAAWAAQLKGADASAFNVSGSYVEAQTAITQFFTDRLPSTEVGLTALRVSGVDVCEAQNTAMFTFAFSTDQPPSAVTQVRLTTRQWMPVVRSQMRHPSLPTRRSLESLAITGSSAL